jgi:predicted RNA-binding Zn ribbon-like protein
MRPSKFGSLRLHGGELCLDFTNTLHDRTIEGSKDYLECFDDLVDWLAFTRALSGAEVQRLRKDSAAHPMKAKQGFWDAVNFRELLFRILFALAIHKNPHPDDLASLNQELARILQHTRLSYSSKRFTACRDHDVDTLTTALWPICRSAIDLLLANNFDRLKKCPKCHWLFYDKSKNGKRRWCSMETCGSIDKSLRYYYRKKSGTHSVDSK